MNTISDCEFLVWLAKRMMYKHKDDPAIVARLEKIAKELYIQLRNFDTMSKRDYSEVESLFK